MAKLNTGGSACPEVMSQRTEDGFEVGSYDGRTLLDHFAGCALSGIIATGKHFNESEAAAEAYDYGAAMLKRKAFLEGRQ